MDVNLLHEGVAHTVSLEKKGPGLWSVTLGGRTLDVTGVEVSPTCLSLVMGDQSYTVHLAQDERGHHVAVRGERYVFARPDPVRARRAGAGAADHAAAMQREITTPMPGKVIKLLVKEGDVVRRNQGLLIVEAMKMENEIKSARAGTVVKLNARVGQMTNPGDVLLELGD